MMWGGGTGSRWAREGPAGRSRNFQSIIISKYEELTDSLLIFSQRLFSPGHVFVTHLELNVYSPLSSAQIHVVIFFSPRRKTKRETVKRCLVTLKGLVSFSLSMNSPEQLIILKQTKHVNPLFAASRRTTQFWPPATSDDVPTVWGRYQCP